MAFITVVESVYRVVRFGSFITQIRFVFKGLIFLNSLIYISCPQIVSLIMVLGQLNGLMVVLYRQLNKKKETNKQSKKKKRHFLWWKFSSITTLLENQLFWICFALEGMALLALRLVRDWKVRVRTPVGRDFTYLSRQAPRPTQSSLKWVPALFPWGKAVGARL